MIYYQILKTKIKSLGAIGKENLYVQLGTETLMFTVTEVLLKLSGTIPDWFSKRFVSVPMYATDTFKFYVRL